MFHFVVPKNFDQLWLIKTDIFVITISAMLIVDNKADKGFSSVKKFSLA